MALFRSKPCVGSGEKARLEYYVWQIANAIGGERVQKPLISLDILESGTDGPVADRQRFADRCLKTIGRHLGWDVSELRIKLDSQPPETCGRGG